VKPGADIVLTAAVRLFAPLIVLFAASIFVWRTAGGGVGFIAGISAAMMLVLHALVFGATAARLAFPPVAARLLVLTGVCLALAGAGLPRWVYAPQAAEAGAFAATVGAVALVIGVLFGRAPTMRDADWR